MLFLIFRKIFCLLSPLLHLHCGGLNANHKQIVPKKKKMQPHKKK